MLKIQNIKKFTPIDDGYKTYAKDANGSRFRGAPALIYLE